MNIQGQILENSERCSLIKKTIQNYSPETIVEIGTWKGLGSTLCILNSIPTNSDFLSIESNLMFYNIAKNNLQDYSHKVKLIHGTIVDESEVLSFTEKLNLDQTKKNWLLEDIANIKICSNVLEQIPKKIDILLLDGGEFSTYLEWIKLKERVTIIMLDDIKELKTNQIFDEISRDTSYMRLELTNEGNGFAIFKKIK